MGNVTLILLGPMKDASPYIEGKNYLAACPAPDYCATNHILVGRFGRDSRVWAHVEPGVGIWVDRIFAEGHSGGERRLLQLAEMLWGGSAEYNITDVLMNLDRTNLQLAMEAIEIRVGLRP